MRWMCANQTMVTTSHLAQATKGRLGRNNIKEHGNCYIGVIQGCNIEIMKQKMETTPGCRKHYLLV